MKKFPVLVLLIALLTATASGQSNETALNETTNADNSTIQTSVNLTVVTNVNSTICVDGMCEYGFSATFTVEPREYNVSAVNELCYNKTEVNITENTTLYLNLTCVPVTINVLEKNGSPICLSLIHI